MDRKKLLQIIDKNLNELLEINQEMAQSAQLSKLELDIALAKAKLLFQEYELLHELNVPHAVKPALKPEPAVATETSPTLFDLPVAPAAKPEPANIQPEPVKIELKKGESLIAEPAEAPAVPENEEAASQPEAATAQPETIVPERVEVDVAFDVEAKPEAVAVAEPVKAEVPEPAALAEPAQTSSREAESETPAPEKPVQKAEPVKKESAPVEVINMEPAAEAVKKNERVAEAAKPISVPVEPEALPKNGSAKTELADKKAVAEQFQSKSLNDTLSPNNKLDQRLASSPIQKLENAIALNDRFQYIRELFNNDAELFGSTIEKIDKMHTIDEALEFLDSQFEWEMDDISLKFIHLVRRRFSV